jgi:hypothetical protein
MTGAILLCSKPHIRAKIEGGRVLFTGGKYGDHSLQLNVSSPERIHAHWEGYCESNGGEALGPWLRVRLTRAQMDLFTSPIDWLDDDERAQDTLRRSFKFGRTFFEFDTEDEDAWDLLATLYEMVDQWVEDNSAWAEEYETTRQWEFAVAQREKALDNLNAALEPLFDAPRF